MYRLNPIRLSLVFLAAVVVASGCGSSSSGLRFPAGTPSWIQTDAIRLAQEFGDRHPASVWIKPGRYTLIVVVGKFRCRTCSGGPSGNSPDPRGTVAAIRVDSQTREGSGFALCNQGRAACLAGLCDDIGCTLARDALDSAFTALSAHTRQRGEVDFDHRVGFHRDCGLPDAAADYGVIKGNCRVSERVQPTRIVVTFTETWHGLDQHGRRTSAGPLHRHTWRVIEDGGGYVQRFADWGGLPPQFQSCRLSRPRTKDGAFVGLSCPPYTR
jgi:hypothetical protein